MSECGYKIKPSRPFGWVARCRCGRYVTASYTQANVERWLEAHVARVSPVPSQEEKWWP